MGIRGLRVLASVPSPPIRRVLPGRLEGEISNRRAVWKELAQAGSGREEPTALTAASASLDSRLRGGECDGRWTSLSWMFFKWRLTTE